MGFAFGWVVCVVSWLFGFCALVSCVVWVVLGISADCCFDFGWVCDYGLFGLLVVIAVLGCRSFEVGLLMSMLLSRITWMGVDIFCLFLLCSM